MHKEFRKKKFALCVTFLPPKGNDQPVVYIEQQCIKQVGIKGLEREYLGGSYKQEEEAIMRFRTGIVAMGMEGDKCKKDIRVSTSTCTNSW